MKFPNNLILDYKNSNFNIYNQYWINKYNYLLVNKINFYNLIFYKKKLNYKNLFFFKFKIYLFNKKFNNKNIINLKLLINKKFNFFSFKNQHIWNLFNIIFLKKEKIYTKLKYSRVPQYDIVSGGVAALFSGFLGFLISEKFGFELIDSGDFYILFMYIVFLCFSLRPLIKIISNNSLNWSFISLKWFFFFYKNIILLLYYNIKIYNKSTLA